MPTDTLWLNQAAAIPLRGNQICLVTSRSGKRWVIPKGVLEPGKTCSEIALQEAWEEAGLVGVLHPHPVGTYLYEKNGITCHVTVFVLEVTQAAEAWPEHAQRERAWVSGEAALERLEDPGLRAILRAVLDGNSTNGSKSTARPKAVRTA